MIVYLLTHDWVFTTGETGHYEVRFTDKAEAIARYRYLKFLIENDNYEFSVHFQENNDGDITFSAYENAESIFNRQDLILKRMEV